MLTSGKHITVAVTGLNANENPGSGIGVIRALRDHFSDEITIIGLAYEALEPGIYMEGIADRVYQIPYAANGSVALQQRIEQIHEKELLDVIIPNFDAELYNFIRISGYLDSLGIKTFLPTLNQLQQREKINLGEFGLRYGFNVPQSICLNTIAEVSKASEILEFPIYLKGKFYEAQLVNSEDEAHKVFHHMSARWGLPVIAQQRVQGAEINVAGLGDGMGNLISVVAMRKQYITDKGKAWAGITIADDELSALAERFTTSLNWKGGFELELIRDDSGKLHLLEVNPRFPAWIYLSAAAGQNQPAMLVKMARGETVQKQTDYVAGKMFVRYSWDQVVDVSQFQQFSAFGEIANHKTSPCKS